MSYKRRFKYITSDGVMQPPRQTIHDRKKLKQIEEENQLIAPTQGNEHDLSQDRFPDNNYISPTTSKAPVDDGQDINSIVDDTSIPTATSNDDDTVGPVANIISKKGSLTSDIELKHTISGNFF